MAQPCKVCTHARRAQVDLDLAQHNGSAGDIARRYGLPIQSVRRHKANHVPKLLASLSTRIEALETDQVLAQVIGLYERSMELFAIAEARLASDHRPSAISAAARAMREARANVELLAELSVTLRDERNAESAQAESVVNLALDEAISEALKRRGMTPQGERAHASEGAQLALPPSHDEDIAEAEIVNDA